MRDTPPPNPADMLAELRSEIDRIDLEMHKLLMARGEIIDRLITAKRAQGGGCAFRPDREAQMMRALVERHSGLLPVDAVEGVWRVIVSTFTYVQMNYAVHADDSGGDAQIRDSARFHFGFTVPYVPHHGAAAVIDAVSASKGDLGMLRAYRELIALRNAHPALRTGSFRTVLVDDAQDVWAFLREGGGEQVLVALCASETPATVDLGSLGTGWHDAFGTPGFADDGLAKATIPAVGGRVWVRPAPGQ